MNKQALAFTLLGLTIFLGVVAWSLPAAAVWNLLGPNHTSGLQVADMQGSLWQGSASIKPDALPQLRLEWSVKFLPLLTGTAAADVRVRGEGADGSFHIRHQLVSGRQSLAGDARVQSRYVNQVSVNYGLETSGEFTLSGLEAEVAEGRLISAAGRLDWPGGVIHLQISGDLLTRVVPPLAAEISPDGSNILLNVTTGSTPLMHVKVKPDGWVEVTVLNALLQTLDLPLTGGSDPAFLLEEKYL